MWASGRGRAGDMLVPPPSTRMARHSTQEDKQMYRVMLVCGWLQPTTASLTFLLAVEYEEGADSHSLLFLERHVEEETSRQLSEDQDLDLSAGGRAVLFLSSLGKGGRAVERMRTGTWGQSPEPQSVFGGLGAGASELCRALPAPTPKAARPGQQPRAGRAARPGLPPRSPGCPVPQRTGGRAGSWHRGGSWREQPMDQDPCSSTEAGEEPRPVPRLALQAPLSCWLLRWAGNGRWSG